MLQSRYCSHPVRVPAWAVAAAFYTKHPLPEYMIADNNAFPAACTSEMGGGSHICGACQSLVGRLEAAGFNISALDEPGYLAGSRRAELSGCIDNPGNTVGVGTAFHPVDYHRAYRKLSFINFASRFTLDQRRQQNSIAGPCRHCA